MDSEMSASEYISKVLTGIIIVLINGALLMYGLSHILTNFNVSWAHLWARSAIIYAFLPTHTSKGN